MITIYSMLIDNLNVSFISFNYLYKLYQKKKKNYLRKHLYPIKEFIWFDKTLVLEIL